MHTVLSRRFNLLVKEETLMVKSALVVPPLKEKTGELHQSKSWKEVNPLGSRAKNSRRETGIRRKTGGDYDRIPVRPILHLHPALVVMSLIRTCSWLQLNFEEGTVSRIRMAKDVQATYRPIDDGGPQWLEGCKPNFEFRPEKANLRP